MGRCSVSTMRRDAGSVMNDRRVVSMERDAEFAPGCPIGAWVGAWSERDARQSRRAMGCSEWVDGHVRRMPILYVCSARGRVRAAFVVHTIMYLLHSLS